MFYKAADQIMSAKYLAEDLSSEALVHDSNKQSSFGLSFYVRLLLYSTYILICIPPELMSLPEEQLRQRMMEYFMTHNPVAACLRNKNAFDWILKPISKVLVDKNIGFQELLPSDVSPSDEILPQGAFTSTLIERFETDNKTNLFDVR